MILPVVAYGNNVLRQKCKPIEKDHEKLTELIENMWETMYNANGVGLAAPQIGKSIRLFLVDTEQLTDEEDKPIDGGIKQAFINAQVLETSGTPYAYTEGCLSIPTIREDVVRDETVKIEYYNEKFEKKIETFSEINARVILHEYDHIEGKLFLDYLKPLKRRMLKKSLNNISKGDVKVGYKMKFER